MGATCGPGRPINWAFISAGRGPFPWEARNLFVTSEYMRSESIRRPSMSKRQARTFGGDDIVGDLLFW